MASPSFSPDQIPAVIDQLLQQKDPATVGLRRILKKKRDEGETFPYRTASFEEFSVPGKTREAFDGDERRVIELERETALLKQKLAAREVRAKEEIAAAREEGKEEGHRAGLEEGRAQAESRIHEAVEELRNEAATVFSAVEKTRRRLYAESEKVLMQLCCRLAGKVIRRETQTDREIVLPVLKKALSYVADTEKLIIRVAPRDVDLVSEKQSFWAPVNNRLDTVSVESDERIEPGGCIVESSSGVVDARLGVQLEELTALVDNLWENNHTAADAGEEES